MPSTPAELAARLQARFADQVSLQPEFRAEFTVDLKTPDVLVEVCTFAKQELGFDYLIDISSIDNYGQDPRFAVVYELYGVGHGCHLRLRVQVGEEPGEIPTVASVWRTADWHEREIFDLMGLRFSGHPDLRRIIMWDGYPHHPLRKDFPLAGKPTDVADVAFTETAPLEGGPFVTSPGTLRATSREPRVRPPES